MGPEANLGKLRQRYRLEYDCNSFSYTGARAFNMQCLTPNTKCPWAQTRATNAAPSPVVCLAARQGFGKSNKKTVESTEQTGSYTMRTNKKRVNLEQLGKEEQASQPSSSGPSPQVDFTKGNWFELAKLADLTSKGKKLVELSGSKQFVLLHLHNDNVYAMDAYSTAYQYPLLDAKILDGKDGPAIETPLDGTQYDLKTGQVLQWCPKDNPIRNFLGTLKADVSPVPLKVYPSAVKPDGGIMVKLS